PIITDPRAMNYEGAGVSISNDAGLLMVVTALNGTSNIASSVYTNVAEVITYSYDLPEISMNATAQPYPPNMIAMIDSTPAGDLPNNSAIYVMGNYWHNGTGVLHWFYRPSPGVFTEFLAMTSTVPAATGGGTDCQFAYRAKYSQNVNNTIVMCRQLTTAALAN